MITLQELLQELERESVTTRNMLSRIPDDKFGWQPHVKSMNIERLTTHIAELPAWITMTLDTSELDFARNPYQPVPTGNKQKLMDLFNTSLEKGIASLKNGMEEQLNDPWTLRNGEQVYITQPKSEVIRMTLCQIVHHRAQLGVYLRLLDIPIPGSYGPSADESF